MGRPKYKGPEQTRFTFALTVEQKEFINEARQTQGGSISGFVLTSAIKAAEKALGTTFKKWRVSDGTEERDQDAKALQWTE